MSRRRAARHPRGGGAREGAGAAGRGARLGLLGHRGPRAWDIHVARQPQRPGDSRARRARPDRRRRLRLGISRASPSRWRCPQRKSTWSSRSSASAPSSAARPRRPASTTRESSARAPRPGPRATAARPIRAVTARAVGRLSTLAELASPLLTQGGVLVAWKGSRDPEEEAEAAGAEPAPAMRPEEVLAWLPSRRAATATCMSCASADPHHGLPRRPGVAKRGPTGRSAGRRGESLAAIALLRPRAELFLSRWAPSTQWRTRRAASARRRPPSTSPPASPRRQADAARRPRPPVQRDRRARWRPRGAPFLL